MAHYVYQAFDTVTGHNLCTLPLSTVTWSRGLQASGGISAELELPTLTDVDLCHEHVDATTPFRTGVAVIRYPDENAIDGRVVCDGFWLPRETTGAGTVLGLTAARMWTLFRFRHTRPATSVQTGDVEQSASLPLSWARTDVADIVRRLIADAQARPGGRLGVRVEAEATGLVVDLDLTAKQAKIADIIEALGDGGIFDLSLDLTVGPSGDLTRTLTLHQPQGGVNPEITFDSSNVIDWGWHDGSIENAVTVTGEGTGADLAVGASERTDLFAAGWPRIEAVVAAKDKGAVADLTRVAEARTALLGTPPPVPSVTVNGYHGETEGDIALLRIPECPRFPDGIDTPARIAAVSVAVADPGDETTTITFADSLAALPDDDASTLASFDRRLRELES